MVDQAGSGSCRAQNNTTAEGIQISISGSEVRWASSLALLRMIWGVVPFQGEHPWIALLMKVQSARRDVWMW